MSQRIIKFRAWVEELEAFVYLHIHPGHNVFEGASSEWLEKKLILPESINFNQQFTGLHDKNGKEIWEGDIMANENDLQVVHIVDWNKKLAAFNVYIQYPGEYPSQIVLGNIHEHPNLLK